MCLKITVFVKINCFFLLNNSWLDVIIGLIKKRSIDWQGSSKIPREFQISFLPYSQPNFEFFISDPSPCITLSERANKSKLDHEEIILCLFKWSITRYRVKFETSKSLKIITLIQELLRRISLKWTYCIHRAWKIIFSSLLINFYLYLYLYMSNMSWI